MIGDKLVSIYMILHDTLKESRLKSLKRNDGDRIPEDSHKTDTHTKCQWNRDTEKENCSSNDN